jgi:hypothetical protein
MDKLWRIVFEPRRVFDELRQNQQTKFPIVTILGSAAISTLVVALLSLPPTPEEIDEYHIQLLLLEAEPDRELLQNRKDELSEELYGPRDLPAGVRLAATFWHVPISVLNYLLLFAFVGSAFWIATKIVKSEILWKEWFAFTAWINLPLVLIAIFDVVLAAFDRDRPYIQFNIGEWYIGANYWALGIVLSMIIAVAGLRSWTSKGLRTCIGLSGLAFGIQLATALLGLGLFFLAVFMLN